MKLLAIFQAVKLGVSILSELISIVEEIQNPETPTTKKDVKTALKSAPVQARQVAEANERGENS